MVVWFGHCKFLSRVVMESYPFAKGVNWRVRLGIRWGVRVCRVIRGDTDDAPRSTRV